MAEDMGSTSAGAGETSTTHPVGNDYRDCTVGSKGTTRSARPNEQCIGVSLRTTVRDVSDDCLTNFLSQWQQRLPVALSCNADSRLAPVEIIQTKLNNVTSPKAQAGKQEKNPTAPP